MAGKRLWRMSKGDWLRTFDECLTIPDESHLIRASVSFDFRPAAGGLALTSELNARIRAARDHPDFMRQVARSALGTPVALGFRGSFAVEKGGKQPGLLDLKLGAILPLVNLVRFHSLSCGVTISPTIDRIDAVAASGGIDGETAADAPGGVQRDHAAAVAHHAHAIEAGRTPDNMIDPGALTPIVRAELREALLTRSAPKKPLSVFAPAVAVVHIRAPNCARRLHWRGRDAFYAAPTAMCGIAGLYTKTPALRAQLGGHLAAMLEQLSFRGPDSAGAQPSTRAPAPRGFTKVSLYAPGGETDWGPGHRDAERAL